MFLRHGPVRPVYDCIVVGSGPAGMSLALALADARTSVLLMESGGRSEIRGHLANTVGYGHYPGAHWNRHSVRALGGTSRTWAGWVAPLDEIDFDNPSVVVRWPIRRADLMPYYVEAARILDRDPAVLGGMKALLAGIDFKPLSIGAPTRFDDKYLDVLERSPTLHVATDCTVVALDANDGRSAVTALDYVHHPSGSRRRLEVAAGQSVVLAGGGISNSQILLQPRPDGTPSIGNESGLVGHFLMEHLHSFDGAECVLDVDLDQHAPPDEFGLASPSLRLADATTTAQGLLACSLECRDKDSGHKVARYLSAELGRPCYHYKLTARSEMLPHASNSVFLTRERDEVGLYRPAARCVVSARDLTNVEMTLQALATLLLQSNRGRVRINNDALYHGVRGGGHVMGTTRMGSSASSSVVDPECRVHGYDNLFVAGSSVFPSGGSAHPTLTIVALALRLAETLRRRLT